MNSFTTVESSSVNLIVAPVKETFPSLSMALNIFFALGLFFLKLIFIGVQLIYNVVLVSALQQSESVIHIHISTLF